MTDYSAESIIRPADIEKAPGDVILVTMYWAKELAGDTIATSSWTLPDGMTEGTNGGSGSSRTCKISGGTDGNVYRVTNTITTTTGALTLGKTVRVMVREQ